jgi:hypothetical protein
MERMLSAPDAAFRQERDTTARLSRSLRLRLPIAFAA